MKFFIDTANVEDIRKANDMGVICGVTTNPSLIAKEGRDFNEVIKEITSIVDGPISGEVKATTVDAEGMIKEGREIAAIHPNMVVKIPMTVEGLKAVKVLSAEGIKTNVTLIFTANQALLAARAGATYVSPFLGSTGCFQQQRTPLDTGCSDGSSGNQPGALRCYRVSEKTSGNQERLYRCKTELFNPELCTGINGMERVRAI